MADEFLTSSTVAWNLCSDNVDENDVESLVEKLNCNSKHSNFVVWSKIFYETASASSPKLGVQPLSLERIRKWWTNWFWLVSATFQSRVPLNDLILLNDSLSEWLCSVQMRGIDSIWARHFTLFKLPRFSKVTLPHVPLSDNVWSWIWE